MHAAGLTAAAIAEVLQVSPRTVGRELAAAGLTPRSQGRPRRPLDGVDEPVRTEGEFYNSKSEARAGDLSTDEQRTEQLRRLLEKHRRAIEDSPDPIDARKLLAIARLDMLLDSREHFFRLREMTRERPQ